MWSPLGTTLRQIVPNPLSSEAWAPFGWLPVEDIDPRDGAERLEFAWGDVHVNRIAHRRDEVPATDGGLLCQMLFRHATHTQVLMPLDVPAVIAVAPPGADLATPAGAEQVRAFRIEPLSSLVLHRGTWHWGPFPVGAESVELFNVQGLRYVEDNECADLEAIGAPVEVRL
jgi:ureidoglycolate hydrolase